MSQALFQAFGSADARWSRELKRLFGKDAGDVRYSKRGEGSPGTELNAAYLEFERTGAEWRVSLNHA